MKNDNKLALFLVGTLLMTSLFGCSAKTEETNTKESTTEAAIEATVSDDDVSDDISATEDVGSSSDSGTAGSYYKDNHLTKDDINIDETYENNADGEHVIEVDGDLFQYRCNQDRRIRWR